MEDIIRDVLCFVLVRYGDRTRSGWTLRCEVCVQAGQRQTVCAFYPRGDVAGLF
ncbi:hypothetical protein XENORESO_013972, partial [Xenotaenia resolanae]